MELFLQRFVIQGVLIVYSTSYMIKKLLLILSLIVSTGLLAQVPDQFGPTQTLYSEIGQAQFKKNGGQWEPEVLYRLTSGHTSIAFYKNKIQFGLRKVKPRKVHDKMHPDNISYIVWDLVFENAAANPAILATGQIPSNTNYFKNPNGTATTLESYGKLTYKNIYPNIDLVFYLDKNQALKYDFVINPGGDFSQIKLRYDGLKKVKTDTKGNLVLFTSWGHKLKEGKPISWQLNGQKKENVSFKYNVSGNTVSFTTNSKIDYSKPIIIDPLMLDWSSYFYGKVGSFGWGYTYIMDMDIDKANNVYVTGFSNERFPLKIGTYDTVPNSTSFWDGFVAKMSINGDSLLYMTYVGGSSWSYILSIAVNSAKQPVISGFTASRDFPITKGAYDTSRGSSTGYRGFITKFSADFKSLVFSTYFGTSNSWYTIIQSMVLAPNGDVIFTGQTSDQTFPVSTGCVQSKYGGGAYDGFLSRISSDGKKLIFSTYFGGTGDDIATELSLNSNEDVYIVGSTKQSNFPLTIGAKGPFKYSNSDDMDGFVARIQKDGKKLIWSKMMGGSSLDYFEGLYVNSNDELYIAGYSNSSDFYVSSKAYQNTNRGGYDHVVVKMNKAGTNVFFSTYIGGGGDDYLYAGYWWSSNIRITANVKDEAIIGGVTKSANYPITNDAMQKQNNATKSTWWATNLAITKLSYDGSEMLYGSYFGGSYWEWTTVLKVKKISCMSSILYGGVTGSSDYPTTKGVFKEKAKSTTNTYMGFMSRFRDTLYTEPINFKHDFVECDEVYEVLDAKNRGGDFLWSDNSTSQLLIVKDTGTYWVRATYGCDTVSDTIHISLQKSPVMPMFRDTIMCDNSNGLVIDAKNDTIFPRKFLWNTSDTSQKISIKKPGAYDVTITTPNCGIINDTINVKFLKTPKLANLRDSLFCDKVNWNIQSDSFGQETKYKWSTGDTTRNSYINKVGKYWVTASNFCGHDSVNIATRLLYTPKVNLPTDTVVCNNFQFKYKVGRANNEELYNWYDPVQKIYFGTDDSMILNFPTVLGVTIENSCGTAKDSIVVKQRFTPTVNLGNDSNYCNNIKYLLKIGKSGNAETYLWNNKSTKDTFTINKQGTFWASISNMCGTATDTIKFTRKTTPTINLGNDTIFCNTVNKVIKINSSDPNATIKWNDGSSASTLTATTGGKFFANASNSCGTVADTVNITLLKTPSFDLGSDIVFCNNTAPVVYNIGDKLNQETYLWSDNKTSNTNSIATVGKHWATITNICGKASDTVNFIQKTALTLDLGKDTTFCNLVNKTINITTADPATVYSWSNGSSSPTFTATMPGKYFASVKNLCGTVSDTINLYLLKTPVLNFGADKAICDNGAPLTLTIGDPTNQESYLWSDGSSSASNTISNGGKYWATITNNCGNSSDTFLVRKVVSPVVTLPKDTALCGQFKFQLDAGIPGMKYLWSPTGETTQIIFANKQVNYQVTVTDADGCEGTAKITIGDDCKSKWYIPNAFSPNGDNINDEFKPLLVNCEVYNITIYNRWGEVLYKSNDIFQNWNGRYNDQVVQDGNYPYVISFKSSEDKKWYQIKGSISVVK